MTTSLAKSSLDLRPGEGRTEAIRRAVDWHATFFRTTEDKHAADPDRSSTRDRRSPPRLVWIVIIAFYIACAIVMIGTPSIPDFDMFAITSP